MEWYSSLIKIPIILKNRKNDVDNLSWLVRLGNVKHGNKLAISLASWCMCILNEMVIFCKFKY